MARKRKRRRKKKVSAAGLTKPTVRSLETSPMKRDPLHVHGSPAHIAKKLMHRVIVESRRDRNGNIRAVTQRRDLKKQVMDELKRQGQQCDTAVVSRYLPVFSSSTKKNYLTVWTSFFTYLREEHGITSVDRVKPSHVRGFMQTHIEREVTLRTYAKYSAAMTKLEAAMNTVRRSPIRFSETLAEGRKEAREVLEHRDVRRGYHDPVKAIEHVVDKKCRIAATLQLEGGARLSEVMELTSDRNLMGIRNGVGHIRLTRTKGGRVRIMKVTEETYRELQEVIKDEGEFRLTKGKYGLYLKAAVEAAGEKWTGTHGLRWNFAQNRFQYLQLEKGYSFKQALKQVAHELGHNRPEITLIYLR